MGLFYLHQNVSNMQTTVELFKELKGGEMRYFLLIQVQGKPPFSVSIQDYEYFELLKLGIEEFPF